MAKSVARLSLLGAVGALVLAGAVHAAEAPANRGWLRATDFGARGDGALLTSCTIKAGATVLACASGTFGADQAGRAIAVNGAGPAGGELIGTVSRVADGKAVLSAPAQTNLEGLYWQDAFVGSDNTEAFRSALGALKSGQCLAVPPGLYLLSGSLSLDGRQSVCLTGEGYNRQQTDFSSPNLIRIGAAGPLLTLRKIAIAVSIERLGLSYFGADYRSDLIEIGDPGNPSSAISISDASIGGLAPVLKGRVNNTGRVAGPAASLIRLYGVYDLNIERNTLRRAQTAIQGPTDTYINANAVRIRDDNFTGGFGGAPIRAAGQTWLVEGNIFEPFNNGYGAPLACGGLALARGPSPEVMEGLTIVGNSWEDARQGQGVCLDLTSAAAVNGVAISGNDFAMGGVGASLARARGVALSGNLFRGFETGVRSEVALPRDAEVANAFVSTRTAVQGPQR